MRSSAEREARERDDCKYLIPLTKPEPPSPVSLALSRIHPPLAQLPRPCYIDTMDTIAALSSTGLTVTTSDERLKLHLERAGGRVEVAGDGRWTVYCPAEWWRRPRPKRRRTAQDERSAARSDLAPW